MSKHKKPRGTHKGKPTSHKVVRTRRKRKVSSLALAIMLGLSIGPASAYTIKSGDSLTKIAREHDTTVRRLARINNIQNPDLIFAGDRIRLRKSGDVKPKVTALSSSREQRVSRTGIRTSAPTSCEGVPAIGYWSAHTSSSWDININGTSDYGNPVRAAASGTVNETHYWDYSYGYHVVAAGRLYAHLSEIYVKPGQYVSRCQVIGRVGMTGNASGPHLHYEIR